ncbi:MAG TPA: pteridine-dependent deoxygenase like protein [Thermoanaerobaculia bacterium]|nr:pteridine-dependent deoxygenase like protein [Thermoanaerobaculia bacterium]
MPDDDGLLFASIALDEDDALEHVVRRAYAAAIAHARNEEHPHLLRVWNYVRDINGMEHGLERYQRFCVARHEAFAAANYPDFPAASAVGTQSNRFVMYFVAAREPGTHLENPRQVSAYRYPPQYGPKSPSFARATAWRDRVFISGTSSVVGYETLHAGDVIAQLEETLRNLDVLAGLGNLTTAKTYLRRAEDYALVAPRLAVALPQATQLFLEADICRPDLLIEIEGLGVRRR